MPSYTAWLAFYPRHPDSANISAVIEMDEVRHSTPNKLTARFFNPKTLGRIERGHSQHLVKLQGRVVGDIPDGGNHVEIRAGERSVRKRELAIFAEDLPSVQLEDGQVRANGGHRVGDKKYPATPRLRPQRDVNSVRQDMMAISNEAREDAVGIQ